MFALKSDSKIYVHTPVGIATGGVELVHQLVSFLRDNGREAYCVLFGDSKHEIHPEYKKYNVAGIEEKDIVDSPDNIEVYAETMGKALIENQRSTQKLFWWLSVDHYYSGHKTYSMALKDVYRWDKKEFEYLFKHYVKQFIKGKNEYKNKVALSDYQKKGVLFAYQSEYIRQHLLQRGITKLVPLMDYINTDYIGDINTEGRDDVILYNPSKGFEFTQKLMSLASDLHWVALRGFTREQLVEVLQKAKIYIDFGNHPGKDRLPRECAMNGCCIITGKRGAAFYQQDVDIPKEYKFDEKNVKPEDIIDKIRFTLANYRTAIVEFDHYRNKISKEKAEFEQQIRDLFCC